MGTFDDDYEREEAINKRAEILQLTHERNYYWDQLDNILWTWRATTFWRRMRYAFMGELPLDPAPPRETPDA